MRVSLTLYVRRPAMVLKNLNTNMVFRMSWSKSKRWMFVAVVVVAAGTDDWIAAHNEKIGCDFQGVVRSHSVPGVQRQSSSDAGRRTASTKSVSSNDSSADVGTNTNSSNRLH